MFNLTAESKQCDDEVADSGHGMAGSFKRNRAYKRKVVIKKNTSSFERCTNPCTVLPINP